MSKDKDDEWGDALDGDATTGAPGLSRDMLRKAFALNPSLRDKGSTSDFMTALEKGSEAKAPSAAAPKANAAAARDLVGAILQVKERMQTDSKRIDAEIAALQTQKKALAPKALERVFELFLDIDPNMTSPQTTELLKREKAFLDQLGFSSSKLFDAKLKRKT